MKYGELFAGCGGMSKGFELAGFTPAWHCEIDSYAASVLRYHYPQVPLYPDVTLLHGAKLPFVDIIVAGFPCQDLSIAGKKKGLQDGSKSILFYEAARIIQEMRIESENQYPKTVVFENVPGLLSSHGGKDFEAVIDTLAEIGAVGIEWRVLDSRFFGVPQRRRRIFIVAQFDYPPRKNRRKVFSDKKGTPRYRYESGQSQTEDSGTIEYCNTLPTKSRLGEEVTSCQIYNIQENQRAEVLINQDVCSSLSHHGGKVGQGYKAVLTFDRTAVLSKQSSEELCLDNYVIRRLTPVECERLQGWEDDWTKTGLSPKGEALSLSDTRRYMMIGNGVTTPVARWVAESVKKSLID